MRCNPLALALSLLLSVMVGEACTRECSSSAGCVRDCDCIDDSANGRRIACPVAFTCDPVEKVCDAQYNDLTCDQICESFAARDLCQSTACTENAQCARPVLCAVVNADGTQGQAFDCTPNQIICLVDEGVCAPDFALSDAQICAKYCQPPA